MAVESTEKPRLAWIWATEDMRNCISGAHEATVIGVFEGVPVAEDGPLAGIRTCKHCRCLFVAKT